MEGPISFWGYKKQKSNLIIPEHDDDDFVSCFNIHKTDSNYLLHNMKYLFFNNVYSSFFKI
jgi:hypothetical protein